MKRFKRAICLVLALLMLVGALVSCKKKEEPTDTSVATTVEVDDGFAIAPEDNGGKEVSILYNEGTAEYDVFNEVSSDSVGSAMFYRDITVEEHLGIDIVYHIEDGSWTARNAFNQKIQASAQAGVEHDYEMVFAYPGCSLVNNSQMGCFKNMYDYDDIIAYDKSWWLGSLEEYAINGALYCVFGDATLSTYTQLECIFFNSEMVKVYDIESPYDLVREGKWTYEKMFSTALGLKENLDADPTISYKNDIVGYMQGATPARGWLTALDIDLITSDNNGNMSFARSASEKLIDAYNYMYGVFANNTNVYSGDGENNGEDMKKAFADGRVLYYLAYLGTIDNGNFAAMEDDWGLVPLPMYNEDQEDYICPLGTSAGMICIMNNANDDALCAKTLECMSYFTNRDCVDEYYVKALGERRARDENVSEMLGIIRSNSKLTFVAVYCGAFDPAVFNILQMDEKWRSSSYVGENVTSYWSSNFRRWNKNLETLVNQTTE